MSGFKVGDKVVRRPALRRRNGWDLGDTVCTVTRVNVDGDIRLAETPGFGHWSWDYFDLAPVAAQQATAQAAAIAGGIQAHSVGGGYPLCVVGYSTSWNGKTLYVVENLQDGTVAGYGNHAVRQWSTAGQAWVFLGKHPRATDDHGEPIQWIKGRPVQDPGSTRAFLVIPRAPKPTLFAQRLADLAKEYGRPLTPYEQYYLAISIENEG